MNGGRFEKIRRPRQVPIYCMCADKRVKPTLYWNQFFCFLLKYLVHSSIDRALYIGDNSTLGKLVGVFIEKSRPGLFFCHCKVYMYAVVLIELTAVLYTSLLLHLVYDVVNPWKICGSRNRQASGVTCEIFQQPKIVKKTFFLFPWYFCVKTWWNTNLIWGVTGGLAGWAIAHPDFDRIEVAADYYLPTQL